MRELNICSVRSILSFLALCLAFTVESVLAAALVFGSILGSSLTDGERLGGDAVGAARGDKRGLIGVRSLSLSRIV